MAAVDRGKRASFDHETGEVKGAGAGAGNAPGNAEDYDANLHEEAVALGPESGRPQHADRKSTLGRDQVNPLAPPIDVEAGS